MDRESGDPDIRIIENEENLDRSAWKENLGSVNEATSS